MGLDVLGVRRARAARALRSLALAFVATVVLGGCADPLVVAGEPSANAPSPAPASPAPQLVDAEVFGLEVRGIDPELLRRLRIAETKLPPRAVPQPGAEAPQPLVETISGYRAGSRAHSEGRAVDINFWGNPYVMHESGEEELDLVLGPIYHRIARLMLGRDSVIPEEITQGAPSAERTMRLYDRLREESRAMVSYFRLMPDRERIAEHLARVKQRVKPEALGVAELTPEALQVQMMTDYVSLSGRAGPPVDGLAYPEPAPVAGDRPFEGDPQHRAPEYGFLHLDRALLRALTDADIRWGGTDMANASGDLMHFYLPREELSTAP